MKNNIYFLLSMFVMIILTAIFIPTSKDTTESIFNKSVLLLKENEEKIIPLNGDYDDFNFSFSNEGIVKLRKDTVSALEVGQTKITATLKKTNEESSLDIYVFDHKFTTREITVGDTFTINIKEQTGRDFNDFDWEFNNDEIIELKDRKFKGLKDGNILITAILHEDPSILMDFEITVLLKSNIASKFVQIALDEEGYVEAANNYTKYGAWYGLPNSEWCAMFVSWTAHQAKIPTNIIPKFASVKIGRAFFEDQGSFYHKGEYVPQKGDLIFFQNGISHVAIVTKVKNGRVYTIEGNTSNKVSQRNYLLNDSLITGYGIPKF